MLFTTGIILNTINPIAYNYTDSATVTTNDKVMDYNIEQVDDIVKTCNKFCSE